MRPVLYDSTTLHFETEKEDGLGTKEGRVDPQIVVGLLVDAVGDSVGDCLLRAQRGPNRDDHPDAD